MSTLNYQAPSSTHFEIPTLTNKNTMIYHTNNELALKILHYMSHDRIQNVMLNIGILHFFGLQTLQMYTNQ